MLSVSEGRGIVRQDELFRKRVALEDVSKYRPVQYGDVVYNPFLLWAGAVGVCFLRDGGCVSPAYQVLRPRDLRLARVLHYFFRSRVFTGAVSGIAAGTVTRRRVAPLKDVLSLEFELPPLDVIRSASTLLDELDAKAESNTRVAQLCNETLDLEILIRESREWREVPVSTLARFVNGGAYTKEASGDGRMVIRIAELNRGPSASTVYNDIDVPPDHIARAGDLLMAWSGSLGVHVWLDNEAIVNQHIFKVIPNDLPDWLVFNRLNVVMPSFKRIAADKATTMGHIKRHHLDDEKVLIPPGPQLRELDQVAAPLWHRALLAKKETLLIAAMRSLLVPELLAGRLQTDEPVG